MSRIAVIGGGISGLAAAWLLARRHDVVLFERDARLGGHTHTHAIETPRGPLRIDTGFIVHNDRTYPLLIRLFRELGIACQDSDMSFAVSDPATDFEYSTRDLNGLFANRRTIAQPSHYALLWNIVRFNRLARRAVAEDTAAQSVGEFVDRYRFGPALLDRYLAPLASAIWSASTATIRDFPFLTLARFFDQHGMLDTRHHPVWRVVSGGSATYIPALTASPRIDVRLSSPPVRVRRTPDAVHIEFARQPSATVDEIVFACHGDEVLPLLAEPTPAEREVLGAFRTSTNAACLHTDDRFLPRRPAARASWNYLLGPPTAGATVTYDLTRLQRLPTPTRYLVTLNPRTAVDRARVLAEIVYTHPLYTAQAVRAQERWPEVSGRHRTHYCGAYWYYGFHEDGLRSAVRAAASLGVDW